MSQTAPFPKLRRGLVAILRGLKPAEAISIGQAIFDAGIEAIEVPLNSPEPFSSIARIVEILPKTALVGAGTVLTAADVDALHKAGGRLLVSPNIDAEVMGRAMHHGMVTMPDVFTPTEAFMAIRPSAWVFSAPEATPFSNSRPLTMSNQNRASVPGS
jgi:2-dehydro-3-deoxyphosphogalactonate aldolase